MKLWETIIGLFGKPNDFHADPYGYLTNQLGHGWLGNAVPTWAIWLISGVLGSYPNQAAVSIFCVLVYLIWWELGWQGWRGRDTLDDTKFFAFGTTLFFVLDMSQVIELASKYQFFSTWRTIDVLAAFHLAAAFLLVPGVIKRIKQGGA